jgi:hypothetical protein
MKVQQAMQKAFQTVNPSTIKTREDALAVLRNNGIPPQVFEQVHAYLDSPIATPILGALGLSKQEFRNGLQSLIQPDTSSASTNSSLLQGIDQLK